MRTLLAVIVTATLAGAVSIDAQFRRGILAESTEISLSPVVPPAMLLPQGTVELQVRNSSTAPARVVEQVRDMFTNQLRDNDARVRLVDTGGDLVVVATVTEWSEARRNSQKYVSETRQIGTKQVVGKDGKTKTEPVYEYGRNKPSVVISGAAGIRVEVRRGANTIADESARHTIQEEHLAESGPPARNLVEDTLIDHAVRKAAGRISPGREPVRVLLARSEEVDTFNGLALGRRWQEWLNTLEGVSPHRDPKRDAYRLHNLAVAHEALAYEAPPAEGPQMRLDNASGLIAQAARQNPSEKYITEARARIARSRDAYSTLAALYQAAGSAPATSGSVRQPPVPGAAPIKPAAPDAASPTGPMSNTDVMDLRALGLDDENLLAAIKAAKDVKFDLTPAGLKQLLNSNVSNRVIAAMRARSQ